MLVLKIAHTNRKIAAHERARGLDFCNYLASQIFNKTFLFWRARVMFSSPNSTKKRLVSNSTGLKNGSAEGIVTKARFSATCTEYTRSRKRRYEPRGGGHGSKTGLN